MSVLLKVPPASLTLTVGAICATVSELVVDADVNVPVPGYEKLMLYGESSTVNELVSKVAEKSPFESIVGSCCSSPLRVMVTIPPTGISSPSASVPVTVILDVP